MQNKKIQVHQQCVQLIEEKIDRLQNMIESAQKASNEDTKSSAGDKYETGRAMMQAEKDKAYVQMGEVSKMRKVLEQIDYKEKKEQIELGSLIITTIGNFYISVALGELIVMEKKWFAISPVSPIGKKLTGLSKNEKIDFNGKEVTILEIY